METVLYIVVSVLTVMVLYYFIVKESNEVFEDINNPYNTSNGMDDLLEEKNLSSERIIYDEDGNIREPSNRFKPTTWDDYEKQLDNITHVEKEDLNIIPINPETPLLFDNEDDEKDNRESEG